MSVWCPASLRLAPRVLGVLHAFSRQRDVRTSRRDLSRSLRMASSSADSAKKMGKAGDSRGTKRAHADSCNPAASRKGASAAGGKSMKGALMEKADNVPQGVRRSGRERSSVERYKPPPPQRKLPRFSITPVNEWDWLVKRMGCSVQNTLTWE